MSITHIVMFAFKDDLDADAIQNASLSFLALKDKCVDSTSNKPYILKLSGGADNSPEGVQNGFTHVFVVEFQNEADRAYYLDNDPAHEAFKQEIGRLVRKVQVIDFTPEVLGKIYSAQKA